MQEEQADSHDDWSISETLPKIKQQKFGERSAGKQLPGLVPVADDASGQLPTHLPGEDWKGVSSHS